jgi:hypothetical protein
MYATVQFLNGLSYGLSLFLVAAGLTIKSQSRALKRQIERPQRVSLTWGLSAGETGGDVSRGLAA